MVRNILVSCLLHESYRVLEADSAAEALKVSDTFEGTIDLVIADHSLKTMSGREVAEQIRQARPGVKVLHVSGYPVETLDQERGLIPGAGFLSKPFLPHVLLEKVRQMLGQATRCAS